jgi:hypothetical protein
MTKLHFSAVIDIRDGNPFILVSADQVQKLKSDWKKPLPVLLQINGQPQPPWKINMMPAGDGSFYLYLHGDVRQASQTKVGDKVMVDVNFDTDYKNGPMHPMPDWFQSALDKNSAAHKNWEALIPSRQKEILRYFSWLKSDEAKKRNIEKAMHVLSGKSGRFMARTWRDGK